MKPEVQQIHAAFHRPLTLSRPFFAARWSLLRSLCLFLDIWGSESTGAKAKVALGKDFLSYHLILILRGADRALERAWKKRSTRSSHLQPPTRDDVHPTRFFHSPCKGRMNWPLGYQKRIDPVAGHRLDRGKITKKRLEERFLRCKMPEIQGLRLFSWGYDFYPVGFPLS